MSTNIRFGVRILLWEVLELSALFEALYADIIQVFQKLERTVDPFIGCGISIFDMLDFAR
jgi:hypothetical protein